MMAIPQALPWLIAADLTSCKLDQFINTEYKLSFYAQINVEMRENLQISGMSTRALATGMVMP